MKDKYKREMDFVHAPAEGKAKVLAAMVNGAAPKRSPIFRTGIILAAMLAIFAGAVFLRPPAETDHIPQESSDAQAILDGTSAPSDDVGTGESEAPEEYEMPDYTEVFRNLEQLAADGSSEGTSNPNWNGIVPLESTIWHNNSGAYFMGEDTQVYQDRYIYRLFKGRLYISSMEGSESRLIQPSTNSDKYYRGILLQGDSLVLIISGTKEEENGCKYPYSEFLIYDIGNDPETPCLLNRVRQDGGICLLQFDGDTLYACTAYEVQIINGPPGIKPVDLTKKEWQEKLHLPHYYPREGIAVPASVEVFSEGGCFTTIGGIHLETGELRFQNTVLGHSEVEFFAENTFYAITSNRMEKTLIQSFCPTDDGILPIASCTLKDTFILRKWARMGDYLCIITKPSENNSMTLNVLDAKLELIAALSSSQDDDTSYAIEFRGSTCYLTVKPIDEFEHEIVALIDLSDPANPKFLPLPEQCLATSRAITYDESRLLFFSKRTTVVNGNGTPASSITMYRMEGDLLEIECRTQKIDGFSYGDTLDNPAQYVWCDSERKLICMLAKDIRYNEHPKTPLGYLFLSYGEDGFTVLEHVVVLENVSSTNIQPQYPNSNYPGHYQLVGAKDCLYILHEKGVIVVDLDTLEVVKELNV